MSHGMRMCAGDARAEGDDEDDVALVDDSIRPRAELTRDAATDVNIHVGVTYMTRSYGGTSCLLARAFPAAQLNHPHGKFRQKSSPSPMQFPLRTPATYYSQCPSPLGIKLFRYTRSLSVNQRPVKLR